MPFHVHHRHNPYVFGFIQINDGVGEIAAKMTAHWRIKFSEALRAGANFTEQPFHFVIKPNAKFR